MTAGVTTSREGRALDSYTTGHDLGMVGLNGTELPTSKSLLIRAA
jgi:hypothetical protein